MSSRRRTSQTVSILEYPLFHDYNYETLCSGICETRTAPQPPGGRPVVPSLDPRYGALIFDHIPHGIFTVDQFGSITGFNSAAENITGWTREEVMGRTCAEIFRSDHCEHACFLRHSMEQGEQHRDQEVKIVRRDGSEGLIAVSTADLRDEAGHVVGGVEMFRDLSMVEELRRQLNDRYTDQDIVSKSPAMDSVRELVSLVAKSECTVLVEGEPGTGKELVARAIHNQSPRRDSPFVAINCGALPDSLAESELFGYVKGAFTDAQKDKPGRFAMAQGGTIFLDEIGEVSAAMQVKLLRVLQEREFTPLGGVAPEKADVRILAATNRDLSSEVGYGRFRQDLFFRLNVVRINIPPLRARTEDIPLLVDHFIGRFNAAQGRRLSGISEKALSQLLGYDFAGNVRELENAVEHAFVVCGTSQIERRDLPPHILGEQVAGSDPVPMSTPAPARPLQDAEAATIRQALAKCEGNRTRAAKNLGISRNTLWRKMKKYGIE
ncbi:MAG: PAS domain S-box protein [bacterium]|nr:PAS domain S-box protein [bacterium]